ncbi:hypothetical protein M3J09_008192 [Ascochyta lentis]
MKHILCLLESVVRGPRRTGFDLVESRSQVRRPVVRLSADRVEVGDCCVFTLRQGNELVACAFDDGEGDEGSGHFRWMLVCWWYGC